MEMGYSVCSSLDEYRQNLLSMTNGCIPSITFGPEPIAKVLSMLIRTHTTSDSQSPIPFWFDNKVYHDIEKVPSCGKCITWNTEIFVNIVKELV